MSINASSQIAFLRQNLTRLTAISETLWHPLGFVSCVIRDEPECCVVRLHYWPRDERRPKAPDWPIHTHVYDLSSLVLMGRVRDIQYRLNAGSEYSVYSVSYSETGSSINSLGREAALETQVDRYHRAGEEYFVPVGSFHQTYVSESESAITLVALSNFQKAAPLVLGNSNEEIEPYAREPFNKRVFWREVERALTSFEVRTD